MIAITTTTKQPRSFAFDWLPVVEEAAGCGVLSTTRPAFRRGIIAKPLAKGGARC
jgi:hypothetical protein